MLDGAGVKIGLAVEPVGGQALAHLRDDRLDVWVVETEDREPVERHLVDEVDKGRADLVEIAVVVEMVGIDIGDHGDRRRKFEERAVGLVGLGDQELPLAELGVGPERSSRPPMTTVGSMPPWDRIVATMLVVVVLPWVPAMAMPYFIRISSASISARGITGISRRCASSTSGLSARTAVEVTTTSTSREILAAMAVDDLRPQLHQALGDLALLQVGAGDLVAEIEQHLGDAAHADAADADKVDFTDLAEHSVSLSSATARHSASSRAAASGCARRGAVAPCVPGADGRQAGPQISAPVPRLQVALLHHDRRPLVRQRRALTAWWSAAAKG